MIETVVSDLVQSEKLPEIYQEILQAFEVYCTLELRSGEELDFFSRTKLQEEFKKGVLFYQGINELLIDSGNQHIEGKVLDRTTSNYLDLSYFSNTFYFGIINQHGRLFFNLKDKSIWSYWLDEGSVAKLTDSLQDLIYGYTSFDAN